MEHSWMHERSGNHGQFKVLMDNITSSDEDDNLQVNCMDFMKCRKVTKKAKPSTSNAGASRDDDSKKRVARKKNAGASRDDDSKERVARKKNAGASRDDDSEERVAKEKNAGASRDDDSEERVAKEKNAEASRDDDSEERVARKKVSRKTTHIKRKRKEDAVTRALKLKQLNEMYFADSHDMPQTISKVRFSHVAEYETVPSVEKVTKKSAKRERFAHNLQHELVPQGIQGPQSNAKHYLKITVKWLGEQEFAPITDDMPKSSKPNKIKKTMTLRQSHSSAQQGGPSTSQAGMETEVDMNKEVLEKNDDDYILLQARINSLLKQLSLHKPGENLE